MDADHFTCETEWVGDSSAVVTVKGELDLATAGRLRDALDEVRERGISDHLVVDLTSCPFIDSSGLSCLVEAQKQATTPLHVAVDDSQVRKTLSVSGLDSLFVLHASRQEAVTALKTQFGLL